MRGSRDGVPDMVNVYRGKAFECLSLAECMNNPEERAEMVRFARVWMSFTEPIAEALGAYEWPRAYQWPRLRPQLSNQF
jgi:hypothetical protein